MWDIKGDDETMRRSPDISTLNMFAILFVGLIAACSAAPYFPHGPPPFHPPPPYGGPHRHYDAFGEDMFDTSQFWAQLATEMRQLDDMLIQFYQKFPAVSTTQGVQGNEYKVTIPLSGYQEKEIVVKARQGLLMVQAVHILPEGGQSSYIDIKTLPTYVNPAGSWKFEDNVLNIIFPLNPGTQTESADSSEATEPSESEATEAPVTEHSREEVSDGDATGGVDSDADVGVRGDRELITNEIPRNTVEATTYAVDLKDEVEFVPVRY